MSAKTLDYVLKNWLLRKKKDLSDWDTYMQILIDGFRIMNLHHTTLFKESILTVNDVNQVAFPSDLVDWLAVGVYIDGEFFELAYNKNLGTEVLNTSTTPVFEEHKDPTLYKGLKYGMIKRNPAGQCNVNDTQRVITFKGDFRNLDISLKYVSNGIPSSGHIFIEDKLIEPLRTYLDWQVKEDDDQVTMNTKIRAEQLHADALYQYYNSQNSYSASDLLDMFRSGIHQSVKR